MTDKQFEEIKARLDANSAILFAGFTAIIQQMNPDVSEQEARDVIIANLSSALEESQGILDDARNL